MESIACSNAGPQATETAEASADVDLPGRKPKSGGANRVGGNLQLFGLEAPAKQSGLGSPLFVLEWTRSDNAVAGLPKIDWVLCPTSIEDGKGDLDDSQAEEPFRIRDHLKYLRRSKAKVNTGESTEPACHNQGATTSCVETSADPMCARNTRKGIARRRILPPSQLTQHQLKTESLQPIGLPPTNRTVADDKRIKMEPNWVVDDKSELSSGVTNQTSQSRNADSSCGLAALFTRLGELAARDGLVGLLEEEGPHGCALHIHCRKAKSRLRVAPEEVLSEQQSNDSSVINGDNVDKNVQRKEFESCSTKSDHLSPEVYMPDRITEGPTECLGIRNSCFGNGRSKNSQSSISVLSEDASSVAKRHIVVMACHSSKVVDCAGAALAVEEPGFTVGDEKTNERRSKRNRSAPFWLVHYNVVDAVLSGRGTRQGKRGIGRSD